MFIARVDFGKVKKSEEDPEELYGLGYEYLCHLLKNGQVYRGFLLGWTKGKLTGHVAMPRPNSFLTKFNCGYSRETLKQLKKAFGQSPQWRLESDPPSNVSPVGSPLLSSIYRHQRWMMVLPFVTATTVLGFPPIYFR